MEELILEEQAQHISKQVIMIKLLLMNMVSGDHFYQILHFLDNQNKK